jgi:hypothetical protein
MLGDEYYEALTPGHLVCNCAEGQPKLSTPSMPALSGAVCSSSTSLTSKLLVGAVCVNFSLLIKSDRPVGGKSTR